jgi:hypothetical protein
MKSAFIAFLFFCLSSAFAGIDYPRKVAILDLTSKNAESNDGELYSVKHILKVSGFPFDVTANVDSAIKYAVIIASSKLDITTSFLSAEKDSLISYVNKGGVFIAPNIKDPYFYSLFGISNNNFSNSNHRVIFNTILGDASFRYLNDTMETTISLGDTATPTVINSREYSPNGALALAYFENNEFAITKNIYGNGRAYAIGFSFKNIILTNQMNRDYDAQRLFSNGFEPTSDAFTLFIKAILQEYIPFSVWLHTSPFNSRNTVMVTHDVDATSAYDSMHYYADYEYSIGLSSTYLITTHYINDGALSDFFNVSNYPRVQYLLNKNHILGSHSVGHFTDFYDDSVFPLGTLGNNTSNYVPFNAGNGSPTTGGTVLGETEVSRDLLNNNFGVSVRTFRSGYLCFPNTLINALDTLATYEFNTTYSAGDVLTAFPYRNRKDRSTTLPPSRIWEFPMCISDVFTSNPISISNYPQKVATWLDVLNKERDNCAPVVLLIHPNRLFKLQAETDFINALPGDVLVTNLEYYADYWRSRDSILFESNLNAGVLTLVVQSAQLPLSSGISFIVENGQSLSQIKAEDENGNPIGIQQSNWNTNDIILHFGNFPALSVERDYRNYKMDELKIYPNPSAEVSMIEYNSTKEESLCMEIYSSIGNLPIETYNEQLQVGLNLLKVPLSNLPQGTYIIRLKTSSQIKTGRIIVQH